MFGIEASLRKLKDDELPWGGVHLIMSQDIFQPGTMGQSNFKVSGKGLEHEIHGLTLFRHTFNAGIELVEERQRLVSDPRVQQSDVPGHKGRAAKAMECFQRIPWASSVVDVPLPGYVNCALGELRRGGPSSTGVDGRKGEQAQGGNVPGVGQHPPP